MNSALRIGLISEHASPMAITGGVDAGGKNVYVAHVARCLARAGHEVVIFTRCDAPDLPKAVEWEARIRVVNVRAGPPHPIPKEALLPYMDEFADSVEKFLVSAGGCDLIHANFFMSGQVAY